MTVTLPPDEADLLEAELRIYGYIATKMDDPAAVDSEAGDSLVIEGGMSANQSGSKTGGIEKRVKYRGPDFDIVVERISPGDVRTRSGITQSIGGDYGISAFTMETQPVSVTTTHTFGPACRLTIHKTGTATWNFRP